jgi:NitT/TauT family transport system permease protein
MSVADRVPAPDLLLPTAALAGGVGLWWLLTALLQLPPYLLPSPGAVADRFVGNPTLYATSAWVTLQRVLIGGGVGVTGGLIIAAVVVYVPLLRRALVPYLVAARVLPKLAVAPLLLIYLGTGFTTGVVLVALITFFPMVVNGVAGFETVPDRYLDLFRSVDAGPVATLFGLRLPYAFPAVFAGLKQSVALAVVGAVVAEWVVATNGLGSLVLFAMEDVQLDVMFAATAVLFVEGFALYGVVAAVERRLLWEPEE